ncbi:MAG: hypothetical protein IV086_14860 [Hyphomonadaceae bacterium]|nr:hypothetical protein [Hyphomonadaceae bacterium]
MRNMMRDAISRRTATTVSRERHEQAYRLALLVLPPVSAWLAFSHSAQEHALDVLLGQGACGNLFMTTDSPLLLGHCLACWSSGATAGIAAFLAVVAARGFAEYATNARR